MTFVRLSHKTDYGKPYRAFNEAQRGSASEMEYARACLADSGPGRAAAKGERRKEFASVARSWYSHGDRVLLAGPHAWEAGLRNLAERIHVEAAPFPSWARELAEAVAANFVLQADSIATRGEPVPAAAFAWALVHAMSGASVDVDGEFSPQRTAPGTGVEAGLRAGNTVLMLLHDFFCNFTQDQPFEGHVLRAVLDGIGAPGGRAPAVTQS